MLRGIQPSNFVVGKCHHRDCGLAYCFGNGRSEPVVILEQRVEFYFENLRRYLAFKIVESDVDVPYTRPGYVTSRKGSINLLLLTSNSCISISLENS